MNTTQAILLICGIVNLVAFFFVWLLMTENQRLKLVAKDYEDNYTRSQREFDYFKCVSVQCSACKCKLTCPECQKSPEETKPKTKKFRSIDEE